MKKIKIIAIALVLLTGFTSCEKDSDELSGNENTGGFIKENTEAVSYVVGNGLTTNYPLTLTIDQAPVRTTKINVYKSFTDKFGDSTNEVLLKSVDVSSLLYHEVLNFNVTYNELRTDLILNGSPLPTADTALNIGDAWSLRYEMVLSNGAIHQSAVKSSIAVGTRFSGTYKCVTGEYYRIGVLTYTASNWPAVTIIEAVDATTYRVKKYFGPFNNSSTATDGDYYFTIDSSDNIDYPANVPGTAIAQEGNTQPFITCTTSPGNMTNVYCGSSNYVLRDNVNGHDRLYMSFGYLAGSGPREFYQVMEKL